MAKLRVDKIAASGQITENTGAVYFDGSGDKLEIADSTDFEFGSNPFTIEFWVYPTAFAATDMLVVKRRGGTYAPFYLYINNGTLTLYASSTGSSWNIASAYSFGHSLTLNVWQHVVFTRDGDEITAYLNGVRGNTITTSASLLDNIYPLGIGGDPGNADSSSMTGYISNFRVCKGHAVYTSNFAPPTTELEVHQGPDDDRTVLLCCHDGENIFADKTGRHIIAAYGDRLSSPTPTATDSPIGITTNNPGLTRNVDPTAGPTFQGGAGFTSQNWLTLPKGTTTERNQTGGRGIFWGGNNGSNQNIIQFVQISTQGNASDFGDLTTATSTGGSCASATRGLYGGGQNPGTTDTIEFITIATTSNAVDFGNLQVQRDFLKALSNSTRGIFAGGRHPVPATYRNEIDFVTIATLGNASDFGDLLAARQGMSQGVSSPTRGLFAGGSTSPGTHDDVIQYITIATEGNAQDFGDLTQTTFSVIGGASSSTRGLFAGGSDPSPAVTNVISYVTIATLGNAQDFGDLTDARRALAGVSNSSRGAFGGGLGSPTDVNTIDYVTIATTGNANDFGDLTHTTTRNIEGCSDSHGGIS